LRKIDHPPEACSMGTVRKTITVTDQQDHWIKAQIEAGHYTNDSEYIRDLIRREQERNAELESIRAALREGESSGKPRPFDPEAFKKRMLSAHG
jgi:antitoxin ParD1/3/4